MIATSPFSDKKPAVARTEKKQLGSPIKLVCAVWGKAYIDQFAKLSLASLLSVENLPALESDHDLELVLLTGIDDVAFFDDLPLIQEVKKIAKVSYVFIDDLIVHGLYSVTLTLSYFRAVKKFEALVPDVHFIFWNSDFVLAEGSLKNLGARLRAGQKLIMTGTLRAQSPEADRILAALPRQTNGALQVGSRDLVGIALSLPQQHHIAKTINQNNAWSGVPSQMFWRLKSGGLIGRFFQAFMLCLTPTRVPEAINGPCDYSFMPEFCPDEPLNMIDNSDEFFALELGPVEQEQEYIRLGSQIDEGDRIANMNEWLTIHHEQTSQTPVVFLDRPLAPSDINDAKASLADYYRGFMAKVAAPKSHANPYYWTWGVAAWAQHRLKKHPTFSMPAELAIGLTPQDLASPTYARHFQDELDKLARRREIWHGWPNPDGCHLDMANQATKLIAQNPSETLLIAPAGSLIDLSYPAGKSEPIRTEPNVARYWEITGPSKIATLVCWLPDADKGDAVSLVYNCRNFVKSETQVSIFITLSDPGGWPGWIEDRVRGALALEGLLSDFSLKTVSVPASKIGSEIRMSRALSRYRRSAGKLPHLDAVGGALVAQARALVPTNHHIDVGIIISGYPRAASK